MSGLLPCLDGDASFIPGSTKHNINGTADDSGDNDGDPDDFRFWSTVVTRQAWRIAHTVREMFGIEYVPDVVVADASLTPLAERIMTSRKLMHHAMWQWPQQ